MLLVQNDHVIQALSAYASDQSLHERILPRRPGCDHHFFNAHVAQALRGRPRHRCHRGRGSGSAGPDRREGFGHLLIDPFRCRLLGHVEMDNAPPIMTQNDETIQQFESDRRHHEEVNGCQAADVGFEERFPGLGWLFTRPVAGTWPRSIRPHRGRAGAVPTGSVAHPR